MRKAILYIACSLDGYIAAPGDDLSFLDNADACGDMGYPEFIQTVDTVILGRRTFDWVLTKVPEWPHKEETYVITRTPRPSQGNVHFHTGGPRELVADLKTKEGGNLFIDGGGQVVQELLKGKLIDEIMLFQIPTLLGDGIRLFDGGRPQQELELLASKAYPCGVVMTHYRCI